jgi:hypothetical protein
LVAVLSEIDPELNKTTPAPPIYAERSKTRRNLFRKFKSYTEGL